MSNAATQAERAPQSIARVNDARLLERLMQPRVLVPLILLITLLAYVGTLGFDFVSDDQTQITSNRFFQSWAYVPRFFTGHAWSHIRPESLGNYYRPLALLWLFVNHMFFGVNPAWWHLTTVLLHLAATLAVYLFTYRVIGDRMTAGLAAIFFGLHPAHIEAVAWVSGFTEPMLAVFCMLSLLCCLKIRRADTRSAGESSFSSLKRGWKWLSLSLILYALALLTKETGIIVPALVVSYEWIFRDRQDSDARKPRTKAVIDRLRSALVFASPYLGLTLAYLVVRAVVLEGLTHSLRKISLLTMVLTWPSLLWKYAANLIWPVGLSAFYDTPYVTQPGWSNFAAPILGLLLIGIAVWWFATRTDERNRKVIAFAVVLLVLPILPLLNLSVLIEDELVHDRYLYVPSIGFVIILAVAVRSVRVGRAMLFGQPALRVCAMLALVGGFGFATSFQELHWANDLVLYHHSLASAPNNRVAKNNLANEFSKRGYYDDAIELYQQLIARDPNHWAAVYDLGCNYYLLGRYQEAEAYLVRGAEIRPMEPKQYVTLAVTLQEMNRLDEAERAARRAIEIRPDGYGFHYELGDILKEQGRLQAAAEEFRAEISANPGNVDAAEQLAEIQSRFAP